MESAKTDTEVCKEKIVMLADTIAQPNKVIAELSMKVHNHELEKLRPELIVYNIPEVEEENCQAVAKTFFRNKLDLVHDIQINKAFRIGKIKRNGKDRPLKIVLKQVSDKGIIYSNAKNLQGKFNSKGKYYKMEDSMPAKLREEKKKQKYISWKNKQSVANKLVMSFKKGKLYVGSEPYQTKIIRPSEQKLLKLHTEEVKALKELEVVQGPTERIHSSSFIGYICDVQSYDEVNAAYEWVQCHNMEARHILCACKIPGATVIDSTDYFDDEEHGGGAVLYNYMDEVGLENRAIFVAQNYDGQHIGLRRFEGIVKAAKTAVNQKPYNTVTKNYQFLWPKAHP